MNVINAEECFNKEELYYCYSPKLKKFLCKVKNISYISKGQHPKSKKTYWLFLKTDSLSDSLLEWSENARNNIKAID